MLGTGWQLNLSLSLLSALSYNLQTKEVLGWPPVVVLFPLWCAMHKHRNSADCNQALRKKIAIRPA